MNFLLNPLISYIKNFHCPSGFMPCTYCLPASYWVFKALWYVNGSWQKTLSFHTEASALGLKVVCEAPLLNFSLLCLSLQIWFKNRRSKYFREHPEERQEAQRNQGGRAHAHRTSTRGHVLINSGATGHSMSPNLADVGSLLQPSSSDTFPSILQSWSGLGNILGVVLADHTQTIATTGPFPSTKATDPVQSVTVEDTSDSAPEISLSPSQSSSTLLTS